MVYTLCNAASTAGINPAYKASVNKTPKLCQLSKLKAIAQRQKNNSPEQSLK